MSGSPKMTKRLPLPVFFRQAATDNREINREFSQIEVSAAGAVTPKSQKRQTEEQAKPFAKKAMERIPSRGDSPVHEPPFGGLTGDAATMGEALMECEAAGLGKAVQIEVRKAKPGRRHDR
jgi:hypothetical protein